MPDAPKTIKRRARTPQPLDAVQQPDALLKMATVTALTGIHAATIYRKMAAGDFPAPVRQGKRCTRWRAGEITEWLRAVGTAA